MIFANLSKTITLLHISIVNAIINTDIENIVDFSTMFFCTYTNVMNGANRG